MKRLLLISYYFPPSGGSAVQRVLKFVRYLPDHGWLPTVLTVDPSYAAYPSVDDTLASQIPERVRVLRTRAWDPYAVYARLQGLKKQDVVGVGFASDAGPNRRRKLARWIRGNIFLPDARIGWCPFALGRAKEALRSECFDALLTTGPPHSAHLVGRRLRGLFGLPWVADMRDPWTDSYFREEFSQTRIARNFEARLERQVLTEADAVVSVSDGVGAFLCQKGPVRRYQTITNGFDSNDTPVNTVWPRVRDRFVISHIGTLSKLQHAPGFLRALARLSGKTPIELRFVGSVDGEILQEYQRAGVSRLVTCMPFVPHAEAAAAMRVSDLLMVAVQRVDHIQGILPVKMYEYLAAGVPILALARKDSELAAILAKTGGGSAFDHDDDRGIEAFVADLVAQAALGKPRLPLNAAAVKSFDRKELTRHLAVLLDDLFNSQASVPP